MLNHNVVEPEANQWLVITSQDPTARRNRRAEVACGRRRSGSESGGRRVIDVGSEQSAVD